MVLEGGIKLTFEQVLAWMRPAFARTVASIQGTEFNEELRIWDTQSRHFGMRHLYVAISRAKDRTKIHIT